MENKIMTKVVFILLGTVGTCWAGCSTENLCGIPGGKQADAVEVVLKQLNLKTKQLKSYQVQVEYKLIQPVFESTTLRKGALYYAKSGKKTKLRINFGTLKQDDEKEQKYREEFIFDGVWLTHINYQTKQVRLHQLAEPNKPVEAFEFVGKNFPIVGFAGIGDMKKQFEIKLIEQQGGEKDKFHQLHLKVRPNSIHKDKYKSIDFWIDKKLGLPARLVAISIEDDIHRIKLVKPKVNKKLNTKIFEVKIPKGFGKEIIPMKKKAKSELD